MPPTQTTHKQDGLTACSHLCVCVCVRYATALIITAGATIRVRPHCLACPALPCPPIKPNASVHARAYVCLSIDASMECIHDPYLSLYQAMGTRDAPITFTANQPPEAIQNAKGLWGGVIVLGRAPTNKGASDTIEGLTNATFGGTDPDDSSGEIHYTRIWHGGAGMSVSHY